MILQNLPRDKEMKFSLKHNFSDVKQIPSNQVCYGETENHFNIPWRIVGVWTETPFFFNVSLECLKSTDDFSVEVDIDSKTLGFSSKTVIFDETTKKLLASIEYDLLPPLLTEPDFLADVTVKIKKINGERATKLRSFDESMEKFSDVVLIVKDEKFYVSKLFLASHSTYFESLLLGNFNESGKAEVALKDIDPNEFQHFLELINGESLVEDETVDGLLRLCDFFDAKTVVRRCQKFLVEKSEKPLKFKFHAAIRYNFEHLKEKCLSEMKAKEDVMSVTPEDAFQFDQSVWAELFQKLAGFK